MTTASIYDHRSIDTRHWLLVVLTKSKMLDTFMVEIVLMRWKNRDAWAASTHGSTKSCQRSNQILLTSMFFCIFVFFTFDTFATKKNRFSFSRYSFIDLAQIVCKVPEVRIEQLYSSSSDEEFDGYISEPSNLVCEPKFLFELNLNI